MSRDEVIAKDNRKALRPLVRDSVDRCGWGREDEEGDEEGIRKGKKEEKEERFRKDFQSLRLRGPSIRRPTAPSVPESTPF